MTASTVPSMAHWTARSPCPQPVCRLMMGAVHHQGLSEKVLQGRGGCPYPVEPVPTRRLAVAGQVLDQCTSEKHVQHLQSPANSQNRLFLHNELLQQEQLSRVPLWAPATGLAVFAWP